MFYLFNTKTQSKYFAKAQSNGDVRKALKDIKRFLKMICNNNAYKYSVI